MSKFDQEILHVKSVKLVEPARGAVPVDVSSYRPIFTDGPDGMRHYHCARWAPDSEANIFIMLPKNTDDMTSAEAIATKANLVSIMDHLRKANFEGTRIERKIAASRFSFKDCVEIEAVILKAIKMVNTRIV